jgi:hypothetical protein
MSEREPPVVLDGPPAPPPGPALLEAMRDLRPVSPRVPARALAAILAVGLVYPMLVLILNGPRRDLPDLPVAWVAAMAVLWAAGVLVPLATAVLPARGEVLPSSARAAATAAAAAALLIAAGLFATVDAPGKTIIPPSRAALHCLKFGVAVAVPVLLVAAFALRGLHPIGGARVAAAVGAAGGALGGLALHFICPLGGSLHVGLGHAGSVLAAALLGALALPRFIRT